ncbi:MAG: cupin domain-containing protein [Elusimicrobiota bacterium]
MILKNIFSGIPADLPGELVEVIRKTDTVTIERIVSRGHSSADGFWYDQDRNEYVILLKGKAGLVFENRPGVTVLKPGDHLDIPAHEKHRVEWTGDDEDTVWLAVYY